ncbi:MAG: NifB/NifX family molybdenum-iron cluster-binding protein [bacterium]|nr:NifB/NifX family molybdenum-iron cluster-binding protein [bacterium]
MKKIRIALGSNDGEKIFLGHMGMARDFYIYDLFENGNLNFVEKRKNTSPETEDKHGLPEKMKVCMKIFKDADVIIGRKMSPNFVKIASNTKFQPVVMEIDRISEIMKEVVKSFNEIYDFVEQRKKGNRPKEIPKLGISAYEYVKTLRKSEGK